MKKAFLFVAALCLSGCPAHVVDTAYRADSTEEVRLDGKKEKAMIESLDDRLGGFVSDGDITDYEKMPDGRGLGYSKHYEPFGGGTWADVYFFNARMTGLKDGAASKEFLALYRDSTSEAYVSARHEDVKNKKHTIKRYNGIDFGRFQFSGRRKDSGREVNSELFLTVYKGAFLKVRISWHEEIREGAIDVDEFMKALTADIKKNGGKDEK